MSDDAPAKLVAVLDAARHAALSWDCRQTALAAAASDVSEGEDWSRVASQMRSRAEFVAAHPWAKRVVA